MRTDGAAEKGELDAIDVADKQRTAKLPFQFSNGVAERWLSDPAPFCSPREAPLAVDGKAIFDPVDFHGRADLFVRRKVLQRALRGLRFDQGASEIRKDEQAASLERAVTEP